MPGVNYTLMVLCVAVTVGFQSTHQLGEAYGESMMMQHVVCVHPADNSTLVYAGS